MPTIYIDNQPHEVKEGDNLLHAALSLGLDLPYFCWHPALGSVGACRQCAVKQFKDENDTRGRIVMACLTPVADGLRVSIDDPEAKAFRAAVVEWLMLNHPHDCPVCDEGGECHLQDMTVMTGHVYRRTRFPKRAFRNQDLGPFLNHEMNRCIECYRCVRFYRDYAGGHDFNVFNSKSHVYFGRHEDGTLENEFSGNLVEVCPTGVFTDKTFKMHFTRKWDLQTAPSVCVHCGLGCNTLPGERYGSLRRIRNRYNGEVNGYFLCDRGRYGYDFVNSGQRIRRPLFQGQPADKPAALARCAELLREGKAIGIGSPRASLESNFALRALVGRERFHLGVSANEGPLTDLILEILQGSGARAASIRDAERADAVLVLGEDITNTAPRLALALRQAVRWLPRELAAKHGIDPWRDGAVRDAVPEDRGPLYIAAPHATPLDDAATRRWRAAPDELARLGFAVAHELDRSAPAVPDLSVNVKGLARDIAAALSRASRPLVVSGTGCGSEAVIRAAAAVARALARNGRRLDVHFAVPECNSLGLAMVGGGSLEAAFRAVEEGAADTVIVLENDLYRRAGRAEVDAFLKAAKHVVVLDHLAHGTTGAAEVALPAGTFAEASGTLVSSEGRAQRFFRVFLPEDGVQDGWRWLVEIAAAAGKSEDMPWQTLDDVTAACAAAIPSLGRIGEAAPQADFRLAGQKVPREPHRYSGRTAALADISVHEPKPPDDPDSPLSFSMEGRHGPGMPGALVPYFWAPSWNSVQSVNKFQSEVGGPLAGGDPGVRLIEPGPSAGTSFFDGIPPPFVPRPGECLVVPLHHIFGGEELSVLAPAIAQRAPEPYLAINPADAADLGVAAGEEVELTLGDSVLPLPAQLRPDLPRGLAGFPAGLAGLAGVTAHSWCGICARWRNRD
jgi:NADH-quinone oxidoreductase subunit G